MNHTDENELKYDQTAGCPLGLAIGDILGCPLEAMHPETIKRKFGRVRGVLDIDPKDMPGTYFWRSPGVHSDDTQQALTLADCFVEHPGRDLDQAWILDQWSAMGQVRIETWDPLRKRMMKHKEGLGCHRGTGGNFRRRIKNLDAPPGAAMGDGQAMRVAPVGLAFRDDKNRRIDNSIRNGLLTSSHILGLSSSVAMASAVAWAMSGKIKEPGEFLLMVAEETRLGEDRAHSKYYDEMDKNTLILANEMSTLLFLLARNGTIPLADQLNKVVHFAEDKLGLQGLFATKSLALTAIPSAITIAARHLTDFEEGVVEAVNQGGDTDTVGAMVGAILGAGNGLGRIPAEWVESVVAKEQIMIRSRSLITGTKESGWVDLIDLETKLTTEEAKKRKEWRVRLKER